MIEQGLLSMTVAALLATDPAPPTLLPNNPALFDQLPKPDLFVRYSVRRRDLLFSERFIQLIFFPEIEFFSGKLARRKIDFFPEN